MSQSELFAALSDEELVAEAKRRGYQIHKKPETIKLMPCVCGRNQRITWYKGRGMYDYQCKRCGLTSPEAKGEKAAKIAWNEMIEAKRREEQ